MHVRVVAEGYGVDLGREELHVYAEDSDLSRRALFRYVQSWVSGLEGETPWSDFSPAVLSRAAPSYVVTKDTLRGDAVEKRPRPARDPRIVEALAERLFAVLTQEKATLRYSQLPDPDRETLETAVQAFLIDLEDKGLVT